MKYRIENCPYCKEETTHKVRKRMGQSKRNKKTSGAYLKRIIYHCCKCNKKRNK